MSNLKVECRIGGDYAWLCSLIRMGYDLKDATSSEGNFTFALEMKEEEGHSAESTPPSYVNLTPNESDVTLQKVTEGVSIPVYKGGWIPED